MNLERLSQYDIQFGFNINPLNWELGIERYYKWGLVLKIGPLTAAFYKPAG